MKGWYVNCANCGKQCEIDGPEDTCIFCGKNASKKEVIMAEKEGAVEERVVPPRPKKRKEWPKYYEQNKDDIIADYRNMTTRKFFKRWTLATTTWPKLKEKWGVQGKRKGSGTKAPVKPAEKAEYKEPRPKAGEFCLLITEEDLAKLEDDDFRLIWVVIGRIIKNRLTDKN